MAKNNNNIQYVDLLKNRTTFITVDELPLNSKHKSTKKKFKIKMFTISLILISVLLFSTGLIIYAESKGIFNNEELDSSLPSSALPDKPNNLLVGLPEQGFLLGSKTTTSWTNNTILQFLGIPFAESPTGNQRYKPPIPKKPWKGILDAAQYGRPCPELIKLNNSKSHSNNIDVEDCLTLNVFTKDRKSQSSVMVYIHGGGFVNGSALEFPPNFLLEKDIVLVVIQYRLGVLGFISTQTDEIPGNAAMHDVILALKWIQKYIKFFGGDSNKITIFGQSSGAVMVTLLTLTPAIQNHKLFHQVIAQSGSIFAPWAINENPLNLAKLICEKICLKQEENYCSTTENINNCLMNANVNDLVQIKSEELSLTLGDLKGILPKLPKNLISNIKSKYNVMIGVTEHDGSFVLTLIYDKLINILKGNIKPRDLFRLIIENVSSDNTGLINNLLYREIFLKKNQTKTSFNDLIPEFIDLCSILYFKSPALTFAQTNSPYNNNKTFLYTFDYIGEHSRYGYGKSTEHYPFYGGSHHSDDNIYLFPYDLKNLNINDTKIAKKMVDLWTSFAIKGIPNINETFELSPIKGTGPYLKINTNVTIGDDYSNEFFAAINDPENYKLKKQ